MARVKPLKPKVVELSDALLDILSANYKNERRLYLTKAQVDNTVALHKASISTMRGATGGTLGLVGMKDTSGRVEYYVIRDNRIKGILAKLGISEQEYAEVCGVTPHTHAPQSETAPAAVTEYYEYTYRIEGPSVATLQFAGMTVTFKDGYSIKEVVLRVVPPAAALALLILGLVAIF